MFGTELMELFKELSKLGKVIFSLIFIAEIAASMWITYILVIDYPNFAMVIAISVVLMQLILTVLNSLLVLFTSWIGNLLNK